MTRLLPVLLNARVKGGNSGGPVIYDFGQLVGIITQMPMNLSGTNIDELGYGLATHVRYLQEFDDLTNVDFCTIETGNDGFKIIAP